jgi:2-amino-4-hydroxy-6-hydroxymethyldihydropteridine diphosphokinase
VGGLKFDNRMHGGGAEQSLSPFFCAFRDTSLMATTLIALGANLGDRQGNLQRALTLLERPPELRVIACSRWFGTAPIGGPAGQAEFVNAAAQLETTLAPLQLLNVLRQVEAELGRQRRQRWAARCVDLDLLLFDDLVLKTPELEVPHPRMAFRRFVLEPAADVAAELRHPLIGWTIGQLLRHLNTAANYVALTGVPGAGKTRAARDVAAATTSCLVADPVEHWPSPDATPRELLAGERRRWRQRAERLAGQDWTADAPAVISDFWLDQSWAYRQRWPEETLRAEFASSWPAGSGLPSLVQPKLLVLLEPPQVPSRWERLAADLRRRVFQPGCGPRLALDAAHPETALVELGAAVAAMR